MLPFTSLPQKTRDVSLMAASNRSSWTTGCGELDIIPLRMTLIDAIKHTAANEPTQGITYIDGGVTT